MRPEAIVPGRTNLIGFSLLSSGLFMSKEKGQMDGAELGYVMRFSTVQSPFEGAVFLRMAATRRMPAQFRYSGKGFFDGWTLRAPCLSDQNLCCVAIGMTIWMKKGATGWRSRRQAGTTRSREHF